MDTTKLVAGQDVYVVSNNGRFFCQGKVTKVAPEGVEVLTAPHIMGVDELPQRDYDVDQLSWVIPLRFDNEGKGYGGRKRSKQDVFWGEQDVIQDGWDVCGFGPWHIDDSPFAERRRGQACGLIMANYPHTCVDNPRFFCPACPIRALVSATPSSKSTCESCKKPGTSEDPLFDHIFDDGSKRTLHGHCALQLLPARSQP
jgi:hypothetical protein